MDNHFVPNLTFGPQMVERIQATSPVPLDVHLMIDEPERWAPEYAELGAASVTFHLEAADRAGRARPPAARDRRARGGRGEARDARSRACSTCSTSSTRSS